MAKTKTLLGPYPSGVTSEKISEWFLHGVPGTYLPPENLPDNELPMTDPGLCPNCGCPDDPGNNGLCHRLLCDEPPSR